MRKICFILTTRGNYLKAKSTMDHIKNDPDIQLQVVVGGILLQRDYGKVIIDYLKNDYGIDAELDFNIIPDTIENITRSSGWAVIRLVDIFERLKPNIVVVIGDRFETLSIAMTAAYMNILIAHIEGGEITGSIDESIRHAVTKLSHIHFTSTKDAGDIVSRLGEDLVFVVGNPSFDIIDESINDNLYGDYVLVVLHPVLNEYGNNKKLVVETTKALNNIGKKVIWIGSNYDADSSSLVPDSTKIEYVRSIDPINYLKILNNCKCIIGNSSSGIRESSFLGIPSVNIGNRQIGRERAENVIDVECDSSLIEEAIKHQLKYYDTFGKYKKSDLYGDGKSGKRIYKRLKNYFGYSTQKNLSFGD